MNTSKGTQAQLATQLVAGTQKHFATVAALMFASGSFTPAQIVGMLQQLAALRTATDTAKAAFQARVATETAQAPPLRTFLRAYVQFVKTTFAQSPDVLADFGLHPNKTRTPLTVEQKAASTAKNKATRIARGTRGPKQKRVVTGDVTGVQVIPVTAAKPLATAASTGGTSAPASATTATPPGATTPHS